MWWRVVWYKHTKASVKHDVSQVSSNVKREASGSSGTSMNFYKNKNVEFPKTPSWQPNIVCCLWGEFTPLFTEHIICVKKESNSGKEKTVFIKFQIACVVRFYYPPPTSGLVDSSLRLAHSITRNETERTPLRG